MPNDIMDMESDPFFNFAEKMDCLNSGPIAPITDADIITSDEVETALEQVVLSRRRVEQEISQAVESAEIKKEMDNLLSFIVAEVTRQLPEHVTSKDVVSDPTLEIAAEMIANDQVDDLGDILSEVVKEATATTDDIDNTSEKYELPSVVTSPFMMIDFDFSVRDEKRSDQDEILRNLFGDVKDETSSFFDPDSLVSALLNDHDTEKSKTDDVLVALLAGLQNEERERVVTEHVNLESLLAQEDELVPALQADPPVRELVTEAVVEERPAQSTVMSPSLVMRETVAVEVSSEPVIAVTANNGEVQATFTRDIYTAFDETLEKLCLKVS